MMSIPNLAQYRVHKANSSTGSNQKANASVTQAFAGQTPQTRQVSHGGMTNAFKSKVKFGKTASHDIFNWGLGNRKPQASAPQNIDMRSSLVSGPSAMMPSIIYESASGQTLTLDPITLMFQNGIILVDEAVGNNSVRSWKAQIRVLGDKILSDRLKKQIAQDKGEDFGPENSRIKLPSPKEIKLYINSPGGSVLELYGLVDVMRSYQKRGVDIATYAEGLAASAASVILALGTPGKRHVTPNTYVMIHQPSGGADGQATDIDINNNLIQNMKRKLTQWLADSTNGKKTYQQMYDAMERDNWIEADVAVSEYGLADHIVDA